MSFDRFLLAVDLSQAVKSIIRDHPFKTSACLRGGGVSPRADG